MESYELEIDSKGTTKVSGENRRVGGTENIPAAFLIRAGIFCCLDQTYDIPVQVTVEKPTDGGPVFSLCAPQLSTIVDAAVADVAEFMRTRLPGSDGWAVYEGTPIVEIR